MRRILLIFASAAALFATTSMASSAAIPIPNGSFESQSGVGQPFGVNILVDSWQKPAKPGYFDAVEANYGIFWQQTAGVFLDTNPYLNHDGSQAAFLLSFPQVALFQDFETVDWNDTAPSHEFNPVFEPGQSYTLTLGVFGKGMAEGATLGLSLYYRDGQNNPVTVNSTSISYSASAFPMTAPLSLVDYSVTVPTVLPTDAWAGKHIGVLIASTAGDGNGHWDIDNARLTVIPEPSSVALVLVGLTVAALRNRAARVTRAAVA